ncbi:MAG: hypothetical protein V7776_04755 [Halopseudomonas aestusnigri]
MYRTGYVRDTYKSSDRRTGLLGLTILLVALLSVSTVSVSLAAILSPEKFLAERMVDSSSNEKIKSH